MAEQNFIKAGFTVVGEETNENKLLSFLKENYPSIIRDTEINLEELKTVLGLPIDEKVNGYGLNFVGRNFAKAKYAQKTEKELRLSDTFSKDINATQNLVLKGDNLESLKILKSYYCGKIKCIFIDPPYNTDKDEFVYPDKFNKEEAEVLGLANLNESDFARMDFSFKTKKSHNGWLAFIYPRLLLARDLLRKEGVIFITIDDNEQANLKILCDEIFGEENFCADIIWNSTKSVTNTALISVSHTHVLTYFKNGNYFTENRDEFRLPDDGEGFENPDNDTRGAWKADPFQVGGWRPNQQYTITNPNSGVEYKPNEGCSWKNDENKFKELLADNRIVFGRTGEAGPQRKRFIWEAQERGKVAKTLWEDIETTTNGTQLVKKLFDDISVFDNPKPIELIRRIIQLSTDKNSNHTILDFFGGSGTTAHAVMLQNAADNGNRKFILCQIDEPIDPIKKKQAYDFCLTNNLPPVISSITVERLKRAADKIKIEIETHNSQAGLFPEQQKQLPDIGFKVFDSVDAPKLKVDETGQISITENETDALSRIYNMIFSVGLDEPTQVPEEVVKDSIYKIGNHYYITNSEKITSDDYSTAIKNGKVFIDGWTASLNGTLQNYKEDVKIVF
jgi:adenine-specific DNA-methyltransferase